MRDDDPRRGIEAIDFRVKLSLLIVSLLTIVILAVAALQENVAADWRVLRGRYAELLKTKATDERGEVAARQFEEVIAQKFVPALGTVDRCQTCHAGVEDPRMVDVEQPFTTHPGRYLEQHDPEKFGCTVCHEGQGRATEIEDAHGRMPHWDRPLLPGVLTVTTCTKCHAVSDLFGGTGLIAQAGGDLAAQGGALLERGRALATEEGCLGCHAIGGKGGTLSRDLTFVGDKTHHEFDFSNLDSHRPREVRYWLSEHFIDPTRVSPGTTMPPASGGSDAAEALTAYMLSLRRKQGGQYVQQGREVLAAREADDGHALYSRYCSACHGAEGSAGRVASIPVPALNNPDTLAAAGDGYYRRIIATGRSGTEMPAWGESGGNLSSEEIDRIVAHMRGWESTGAPAGDASARSGDARRGRAYYRGMCAGCHGARGEGGIGNSLRSETFLAVADDRFLAKSIVHGRPGTAMPSWKQLPTATVSDLLALIRSWQPTPPAFEEIEAALSAVPAEENERIGRTLYRGNCAACHGAHGEGGAGPSLTSSEFLALVDDRYLARAITEGRPSTAMPAWRGLSAEDIAALIVFLRGFQRGEPVAIVEDVPPGDYALGEVHFRTSCAGCHGEEGVGGVGPQLANPVFLSSVPDGVLYRWIAYGRSGTAMKGFVSGMQGPTELTPGQIADVIAYLRHLGTRAERGILRTGVGDAEVGAEIFHGHCASCHGPDGEGASGPQLANPAFLRTASDGFLLATVTLGRSGTPMPPMVDALEGMGQLTPKDVQDLIAFMRLWESPGRGHGPRRIVDLSDRAVEAGATLYDGHCAGCHGPTGLGAQEITVDLTDDTSDAPAEVNAPALNNPEFLQAASDGFLLATIARGRARTAMRPFGRGAGGVVELSAEDINDIVSYIRSWQTAREGAAAVARGDAGTNRLSRIETDVASNTGGNLQ